MTDPDGSRETMVDPEEGPAGGARSVVRLEPATVLHVLAGVSLGISLALAPGPDKVGAGSLLILVALASLLDGLLAQRARRRARLVQGLAAVTPFAAYPLLVTSLFAFFGLVRSLAAGGWSLWAACAVVALAAFVWRDLDEIDGVRRGDEEGVSRRRVVVASVGAAPCLYYLVYGAMGLPADGFWAASAALFHAVALVVRRLADGPLASLLQEPDEREIERLLIDVRRAELGGGAMPVVGDARIGSLSAAPGEPAVTPGAAVVDEAGATLSVSTVTVGEAAPAGGRDEVPGVTSRLVDVEGAASLVGARSAHLEPVAGEPPDEGVLALIERGLAAWEAGRDAEALECFLEAVTRRPDMEEPTLWAVQLVRKEGLAERARDLLVEFLRGSPESYAGFFQLGRLLAEAGKSRLAARAFRKASRLCPSASAPLRELARLAVAEGDTGAARRQATMVLELEPDEPWARDFLAEVEGVERRRAVTRLREEARSHLARQERGAALRALRDIAALDPADTEARLRGARILLETGSPDEAVALFEQAVSLPFEHREGHELPVELARAYLERGETERALDELRRSTSHMPLHLDLGFLRLDVLAREGRWIEVEEVVARGEAEGTPPEAALLAAHGLLAAELGGRVTRERVDEGTAALLAVAARAAGPTAPYEPEERFRARLEELAGRCAARRGLLADAVASYERAAGFDGRSVAVRDVLSRARLAAGEPGRAVVHLQQLVRLQPAVMGWRVRLVDALLVEARARSAQDAYYGSLLAEKRARLAEFPDDPTARFEAALVMLRFGGGDPSILRGAGVEHQLRMALRAAPCEAWFAIVLAGFLASDGGPAGGADAASELLSAAAERCRDRCAVLAAHGELLERRPGDGAGRALALYREAAAADPSRADAFYGQGRLLVVAGRDAEAAVALRRALLLDPFHAEATRARDVVAAIG